MIFKNVSLLISSTFVFVAHILKPVSRLNIYIEKKQQLVNVNKVGLKYDEHAYI